MKQDILHTIGPGEQLRYLQNFYRPGEAWRKQGKRYRSKDNKVSLWQDGNVWVGKDFSNELPNGNVINVIATERVCSPAEAAKTLANELGITDRQNAIQPPQRPPKRRKKKLYPYQVNHDRNKHPKGPQISAKWEVEKDWDFTGYPKPLKPETLRRYGVQKLKAVTWLSRNRKQKARANDPLYLIGKAGGNAKIYRPKAPRVNGFKKPKQLTATYAGNYCFGFDQLPERCKYIIITAGQNDTMATNELLNDDGIYAVCLWSESSETYLHPELLAALQKRCERVFVAYDDDKAGNKGAQAINAKFGLAVLQIPHTFKVNDICDALEEVRKEELKTTFKEAIKTANQEGKIRYVSQEKREILEASKDSKYLLIPPPPGAGKSYSYLAKTEDYTGIAYELAEEHGFVTFIVPHIAAAEQLGEKYNLPFLTGRKPEESTAEFEERINHAINARVCIAVWDKANLRPNSYPIVDEFDELTKAIGYRESAQEVFSFLMKAEKATFLTATPPYGIGLFGVKNFPSKVSPWQKVSVYPYILKKGAKADERLFCELQSLDYKGGITLVYINDKKKGRQMAARLQKLLPPGKRAVTINSDERGDDYEYLVKNNRLPQDIAIAIVTKFVERGVNIDNEDIRGIFAVPANGNTPPDPADMIQLAGRARKLKTVPLHLFLYPREGRPELSKKDITQMVFEAANELVNRCKQAQNAAKLETLEGYSKDALNTFKSSNLVQYATNGEPEINGLEVLATINKEICLSLSTEQYLQELCTLAPYFELSLEVREAGPNSPELEAYQEAKKESRYQERKADALLTEFLVKNHFLALEACYFATNDRSVKQDIRKFSGLIGKDESPQAAKLRKDNKDVFLHTSFRPLKLFFKLYSMLGDLPSVRNALTCLHEESKAQDLERLGSEVTNLEETVKARSNYDDARAVKLKKLYIKAGKKEERLERYTTELEARRQSKKATATKTAEIERKAAKMRADLEALQRDIAERHRDAAERLEDTAAMGKTMEKKRAQAAAMAALYDTGLYINPRFYHAWKTSFSFTWLLHLTQGKNRRARMAATLPDRSIQAEELRAFKDILKKNKGRNLSATTIAKAWQSSCTSYPIMPDDETLKADALAAFKALFHFEKKGKYFVITCAKNWEKMAQNWGIDTTLLHAENQPLERLKATFSNQPEKMARDGQRINIKYTEAQQAKTQASYQATPWNGDWWENPNATWNDTE